MNQKAMSPGKLVLRRFLRNKLALVGIGILLLMFLFSFVGPHLYPYGQTEVFQTYGVMNSDIASAVRRTEYALYPLGEWEFSKPTAEGLETGLWVENGRVLVSEKQADGIYTIGEGTLTQPRLVGVYNSKLNRLPGTEEGLTSAVSLAVRAGQTLLLYENRVFFLNPGGISVETEVYEAVVLMPETPLAAASLLHYERTDGAPLSDMEQTELLLQYGGKDVLDEAGHVTAQATDLVIRDTSGKDTFSWDFKEKVRDSVENMENTAKFFYPLPSLDDSGELVETEVTVTQKPMEYAISCTQRVYMLSRYAPPSKAHPLGTDGDGMDVLARMMAGGRISLLVGFVVVLLEVLLGVLIGGLAGYFGGWTDTALMRLVDVFYCVPSMPILIILGAMFDAIRMAPYARLFWLMAVLGFLGWASIARLVRGQILSLREQEFMVAAEAAGLPASRRIFRHLIPNVMPQLIVTATMGLGSVILTESTLSFLGLGVKHPMATWGTMINSVAKSAETMMKYTHIWLPVGLLICLTVIAFNFVGDGLRDALDPKMKR